MNKSGKVAQASTSANRCGQGEKDEGYAVKDESILDLFVSVLPPSAFILPPFISAPAPPCLRQDFYPAAASLL
jgi:hypothetical protein